MFPLVKPAVRKVGMAGFFDSLMLLFIPPLLSAAPVYSPLQSWVNSERIRGRAVLYAGLLWLRGPQ